MPGSYMRPTLSGICETQVACDGNYIQPRRLKAGAKACAKCEKALERKARGNPPLRGSKVYRRERDE